MKKFNFFSFFVCLLLLASCKKTGEFLPSGDDEEDNTTTLKHGQAKEKKFMLAFIVWYRNNLGTAGDSQVGFEFRYNDKGQLDSVGFNPFVYGGIGIHRKKGKIDTIFTSFPFTLPYVQKTGFEYDRRGDITRFTHTNVFYGQVTPIGISYDQGHAHRITQFNTADPSMNAYNIFTYDKDNIARWTMVSGSSRNEIKYTYDRKHLNPVYFIDDLVPIFSFEGVWEFMQESENVSTSKYYVQSQQLIPFQNFYDRKDRLIKKVWTDPSMPNADSLVFHYVN